MKQEKRDANSFASRLFHATSSASGRTRRPAVASLPNLTDGVSNVVHRTRIQLQYALKIPNGRPQGTPLQAIAPYLDLCKSIQIQANTKSQGQLMSGKLRNYSNNVLIAISRLLNAVLGGNPSLTLSARAGLHYRKGQWRQRRWLINILFWLQDDHCELAIRWDTDKNQQAIKAVAKDKVIKTEPL